MLINQLLLTFIFNDNSKIIEATHQTTDLEAIHQIDDDPKVFLAYMV